MYRKLRTLPRACARHCVTTKPSIIAGSIIGMAGGKRYQRLRIALFALAAHAPWRSAE